MRFACLGGAALFIFLGVMAIAEMLHGW
jgi:hypothetical protein